MQVESDYGPSNSSGHRIFCRFLFEQIAMNDQSIFENAVQALNRGDVASLTAMVAQTPEVVTATDDENATLLLRLIDWPGNRPNASISAQILLNAGADVEARRDKHNGTPLSGALCLEDQDLLKVLLDAGADIHAECGWQEGSVLDHDDWVCENMSRRGDESIVAIGRLFSKAAGRSVPKRTRIGGTVPVLFVSDFDAGVQFYTQKLGFKLLWRYDEACPDDPYGSIARGQTEFHITGCQCEGQIHVGRLDVRIETESCADLFEEFRNAGDVTFRREPKTESWGLTEFEIEDPDGNRITFFQH